MRCHQLVEVKVFQMHNCKQTREDFIDLALAEQPVASTQLLQELDGCAACREEFASLRDTLNVSGQALRSTLPGEDFWQGYHARLRVAVLANASQSPVAQPRPLSFSTTVWQTLRTFATSSFRLPVPAAIVAVLLLGISLALLLKTARANANTSSKANVVETKTIEVPVPVFQEKVVTKVVYVDRKNGRSVRYGRSTAGASSDLSNSVATAGSIPSRKAALSLVGFKPTDEVKFTIIKGSHRDEK